jgi:hypothetical protein
MLPSAAFAFSLADRAAATATAPATSPRMPATRPNTAINVTIFPLPLSCSVGFSFYIIPSLYTLYTHRRPKDGFSPAGAFLLYPGGTILWYDGTWDGKRFAVDIGVFL